MVNSRLPWEIVMLENYYVRPVSLDTTNRYAELTLRAKAEALRVCEVGSGISAASRGRAAWKDDKTLLHWLNAL